MMMNFCIFLQLVGLTAEGTLPNSATSITDVLRPEESLADGRLNGLKTLNTPQSFQSPETLEDWQNRKEELRYRVLASCGLWPMPEPTPVRAQVFEKKEYDGFSVEKVLLETCPGYYATGNLYRPLPAESTHKYPGILCPHGHWPNGRFENSEKGSIPGRAINFARQGYVCFTYDMVGFGDHKKLFPGHKFGGDREALWAFHPAAVQLCTSIRAIDFLQSLDDVDPEAIGCTGASGGGTQTFLLCAVDDRVKVAAPVNMISHSMQGGCKCENPPHLRLDTNNMEIGAMMAPRPLILISATGDWTAKTPEVEYPAIRSVYALYDSDDKVAQHQVDADHNYNRESREHVYAWFGKWFYPDRSRSEFREKEFEVPSREDLSVFAHREIPKTALSPQELFASLRKQHEQQLLQSLEKGPSHFEETFGRAWRMTLNVQEPDLDDMSTEHESAREVSGSRLDVFLLCNQKTGQKVPANLWLPSQENIPPEGPSVLLVHPEGKAALLESNRVPGDILLSYLKKNQPVLTIDMFGTGEYLTHASPADRKKDIDHFTTYNLSDPACRIQDILLAESFLAERFDCAPVIQGLGGAGGEVLLAHGLATRSAKTVVDLSDLDFTDDRVFVDILNIPNIRRAGDFVTSIILGAVRPVEWIGCNDPEMEARLQEARKTATEWYPR
jgi:hypothetical protein